MKKCIWCGCDLEDDALFCDECGRKQNKAEVNSQEKKELLKDSNSNSTMNDGENRMTQSEGENKEMTAKGVKNAKKKKKGKGCLISILIFIGLLYVIGITEDDNSNTEIQSASSVDVSQGTDEISERNDTNSNVEKDNYSEPTEIPETVQNEKWKEKYNIGETMSFKASWLGKESLIESVDYELTFMDEIVEYNNVMDFENKTIYIPFSIANNSKQELAFDLRSIYVDIDGYEYHDIVFREYNPINELYYPVDFGDIMPSTALIPAGGEYLAFLQLSYLLEDIVALRSIEPHKVQIGFTYDLGSIYDGKFEIPSASFWTVYEDYFQVLHPRYKEVYVTTEKEVDELFCGTWYVDGMGDYPVLTVNKNGDIYDIYIINYIDNDYHVWAMTGKYDYEKHCMAYDDLTRTRYSLNNYEYQAYEIGLGYTSGSLYYDIDQIRLHWSQYGDSTSFYRSNEEYKSLEDKFKEIGIIKEPVTGENVPSYELGNIFELGSSPATVAEACEEIGVPIITYNRGVRYYSYDEGLNISRKENGIYVTLYGCNTANYSLWGYYVGMDVETLYSYIAYDELEIIDESRNFVFCNIVNNHYLAFTIENGIVTQVELIMNKY